MAEQAEQALQDIANEAQQTQTIAPDLSRQVVTQAAAGSGLAGAVQEAQAAPQDEGQLALVAEQKQKTQEVRQQAALAKQALTQGRAELEQRTRQELANLTEQEANQVFEYRQKAQNLFQALADGRGELSFAKERAATEQAGFLLRQSSKSYIDTLQLEGRRNRLDTGIGFKQAMLKNTFADMEDLLESDINFRRAISADQREFEKYMANMDLDTALSIARGEIQTAKTAGAVSAVSSLASTGAKAYAAGGE